MTRRVLGLDLGPNSVGWALVNDDPDRPAEAKLVDLGARVFPEGVDNFDTSKELSRNEDRRIARGMRRQIRRRARRHKKLKESLVTAKLWPTDPREEVELYELDPYDLRAQAVSERLKPFEIGRVLLHLNQRRGFLSNRKKDRGDKEVQGMLAEINENERERQDGGFPTIGAWLAHKHAAIDHTNREANDHTRNRHLARDQYEAEFESIWEKQAEYYPELLTERLKYGKIGKQKYPAKAIARYDERRKGLSPLEAFGIYGTIFFQRPMYWPKSVVGLCELEPKQKRCPRADRHAQRFRLLQELNNLRYTDPDAREECALSNEQRTVLLEYLGAREKATFEQIKKKLGFLETVKFNLERGQRPSIKGMVVDYLIAARVGKSWHDRSEEAKDAIVRMLLDNERDDDIIVSRLVKDYRFEPDEAEAAVAVDLPAGYSNLSLKAIDNLLPHLERGMVYQSISDPEKSALHAAGYLRRDELRRRLFDKLPDPCRVRTGDLRIGDIPNPVVKRALVELRKVVNAIIREYGKPDAVHLEMTRTLQMGREKRSELNSQMREREAKREQAAAVVREMKVKLTRDAILRYLIWEEQAHECVYCGKPISQKQLFTGEADLDHILPYSRCLDDSQMNKVVCHRKCNHGKGNRTPHEWLAHADPDAYDRLCLHVGSLLKRGLMPYRKYRRFLQKELELGEFVARQLTDTGYIVRATGEYLRCLFDKDHHVLGLKGQLTAELRWHWGLDSVLEEMPDSPAWRDNGRVLRPGEKNRADHRHHAIDAVVVALTNRRRLYQLSDIVKRGGAKAHGEVLEDPWPGFREDVVQAVKRINVSHRVEKKVRGGLHKDNPFGRVRSQSDQATTGTWVKRKPVIDLSASEILQIRDNAIRDTVVAHLRANNVEIKITKPQKGRPRIEFESLDGEKLTTKALIGILSGVRMASGVPVRKVRIVIRNETVQEIRTRKAEQSGDHTQIAFVEPDDLHHACLFELQENGKTFYDAVYVSRLKAAERRLNQESVIQKTHPQRDDAKFLFSICTGDLVVATIEGQQRLMKVSTMVSTQKRIHLVDSADARRSSDKTDVGLTPNTFFSKYLARKVLVDPLGRIRWAND